MHLRDLEQSAQKQMEYVRNDSYARYRRRVWFYRRHGFGSGQSAGFGASELAFMRWAMERGVLNSLDHPTRPGSPFWRDTNEHISYLSELAALVAEHGLDVDAEADAVEPEVRAWLAYFAEPSGRTWYEAHNRCLAAAMVLHREKALAESLREQRFICSVLCRVIFAEALARGALLGAPGRRLFCPSSHAVSAILRVSSLYPRTYRSDEMDDSAMARAFDRALPLLFLAHESGRSVLAELIDRYLSLLGGGMLSASSVLEALMDGVQLYPRRVPRVDPARRPMEIWDLLILLGQGA